LSKYQSRLKKRITIKYDPKAAEATPARKRIISVLLSSSSEFDEAKKEFVVESLIDETDDSFSGCCQLCGTTGLKYNFVLHNPITGKRLQVGTTCIIRFGVGQGVYDFDTGITLLQNIADERYLINEIQTAVTSVMAFVPDAVVLARFVKNLRKYMEVRGIKNPSEEQLKQVFFGGAWKDINDPIKLDRMRTIWDRPAYIPTTKPDRNVNHKANPKEGTTWYKKRRHVLHHTGSSEIFKVEDYVTNKVK
jgi:hypothetical protein